MQLMPDGTTDRNYLHRHVLRAAVNGEEGTTIKLTRGETRTYHETFALPTDVRSEHAWLVAFVYNDSGVLQVVRRKLKTLFFQNKKQLIK